eukprot:508992-Prymnesium_polylepis.1
MFARCATSGAGHITRGRGRTPRELNSLWITPRARALSDPHARTVAAAGWAQGRTRVAPIHSTNPGPAHDKEHSLKQCHVGPPVSARQASSV